MGQGFGGDPLERDFGGHPWSKTSGGALEPGLRWKPLEQDLSHPHGARLPLQRLQQDFGGNPHGARLRGNPCSKPSGTLGAGLEKHSLSKNSGENLHGAIFLGGHLEQDFGEPLEQDFGGNTWSMTSEESLMEQDFGRRLGARLRGKRLEQDFGGKHLEQDFGRNPEREDLSHIR